LVDRLKGIVLLIGRIFIITSDSLNENMPCNAEFVNHFS
jgi:hypothetical protein